MDRYESPTWKVFARLVKEAEVYMPFHNSLQEWARHMVSNYKPSQLADTREYCRKGGWSKRVEALDKEIILEHRTRERESRAVEGTYAV